MSGSFWLVTIDDSAVTVAYSLDPSSPLPSASCDWSLSAPESLVSAVDRLISQLAAEVCLSSEAEPSTAAFVLPPYWLGPDGKINADKIKIIELLCKSLKLSPLGFIAADEAIVEDANRRDGFPASFLLVNFSSSEFTLSFVYLGKVKSRLRQTFSENFDPSMIEQAIIRLNPDVTLPPHLVVFGQPPPSAIDSLKDYPWIGKKDVETFLHHPEISFYPALEVQKIFSRTIVSQINPQAVIDSSPPPQTVPAVVEVDPADFGFGHSPPPTEELPPPKTKVIIPPIHFHFPRLPRFHFPFKKIPWLLPLGLLLLLAGANLLSTANLTIYLTPYQVSQTSDVVLVSPLIEKKNIDVKTSAKTSASGQKTVGEKAKGEIVVYNIQNKSQNITKGAVLLDSSGRKFELLNSVTVASSSADLDRDQGVINLGQTRVLVSAADIGPEYNLAKNTKLNFKDFPDTVLIAKAREPFVGGSKRQITVVTDSDKSSLTQKIKDDIKSQSEKKISEDIANLSGALPSTIKISKTDIVFNREVGEEADTLEGQASGSVSVFLLTPSAKQEIVAKAVSSATSISSETNPPDLANFEVIFKPTKVDDTSVSGQLSVSGFVLPRFDLSLLRRALAGKPKNRIPEIIKSRLPRAYNYRLTLTLPILGNFSPLPFLPDRITIDVKSEKI